MYYDMCGLKVFYDHEDGECVLILETSVWDDSEEDYARAHTHIQFCPKCGKNVQGHSLPPWYDYPTI